MVLSSLSWFELWLDGGVRITFIEGSPMPQREAPTTLPYIILLYKIHIYILYIKYLLYII